MERKPTHRKNASTVLTARTRRTSADKSREGHGSKSKDKPADLVLQNKIKKRMSFKSPSRKDSTADSQTHYKNLNLLNYLLFKEKQGTLQLKIPQTNSKSGPQILNR